jgi:glycosyltransferase involved in cell wall biosynthesis
MAGGVRIVGSVLVRNEDVFVERAISNVAAFCDRIHVLDQESVDRTPEILRSLGRKFDHVQVMQSADAADSHRVLEKYAGTETWVLGVDGDELYDPEALARIRDHLLAGAHADVFRLKGHVLNCDELRMDGQRSASGFMAPPSRPVTKLFNMAAVTAWTGCPERLHAGSATFRRGFDWETMRYLSNETGWDSDPLRLLHVCFLRRSSHDDLDPPGGRASMWETGVFRRGILGLPRRIRYRRHMDPRIKDYQQQGRNWKQQWYRRGERVTVDASPFLPNHSR